MVATLMPRQPGEGRTETRLLPRPRGRRANGDLVVAAAIGVGVTAAAAARGGADFLLALNAGRLRVMGASSIAAMLPIAEANDFTRTFACREILGRVDVPVLIGLCASDPRADLGRLVKHARRDGFAGIANFPTVIHLDGRFRIALEEAGLGFAREVALLRAARRAGLATLGYAKRRDEVLGLVAAGVDALCVNFGWNAGGVLGLEHGLGLDEAADRAQRLFQLVRKRAPAMLCLVEGGPIVTPEQMLEVCRRAGADGYVGGSTLDRLPLEIGVAQATSAYKTAGLLRPIVDGAEREVDRVSALAGLVGHAPPFREALRMLGRIAATDLAALVTGESGTGKTLMARALHLASRRRVGPLTLLDAAADRDIEAALFGVEGNDGQRRRFGAVEIPDATIVLENIDRLPAAAQHRVAVWLESGMFVRGGGLTQRPALARLVATSSADLHALAARGAFRDDLLVRLLAARIALPALRDRPEDVAMLARAFLVRLGGEGPRDLDSDALRVLLRHDWPGNLREMHALLSRAAVAAQGRAISAVDLAESMRPGGPPAMPAPLDERAWILDGLRRNRFRRGETAAFLGISRKTLYNRMRRLGLEA